MQPTGCDICHSPGPALCERCAAWLWFMRLRDFSRQLGEK